MRDFITNYWIEVILGLVSTGLLGGLRHLYGKQKAIENGVKAMLRDRLIQSTNHYREKGFCPIYALTNMESMYKEYHALGGNGTVATLIKEMHNLPREEKE